MPNEYEKKFFEKTMQLTIDMKIELIKEQIAQGEYKINCSVIADKMLNSENFKK